MTDRELLEDAAKAAGIDTTRCLQYADGAFDWPGKAGRWNPFIDDGDAFRLAVKLKMKIDVDFYLADVEAARYGSDPHVELLSNDPLAATRRAIVRAAAEIGRGMK